MKQNPLSQLSISPKEETVMRIYISTREAIDDMLKKIAELNETKLTKQQPDPIRLKYARAKTDKPRQAIINKRPRRRT